MEQWVQMIIHNRHGTQDFNIDVIKPSFIQSFKLVDLPEVVVTDSPNIRAKFRYNQQKFQSLDIGSHIRPETRVDIRLSPTQQINAFSKGTSHLMIVSKAVPKGELYGAIETHDHYVCLEEHLILCFRLTSVDLDALPVYKPHHDYFIGAGGLWITDNVKHVKIMLKLEIGYESLEVTRGEVLFIKGAEEGVCLHIESGSGKEFYQGFCAFRGFRPSE